MCKLKELGHVLSSTFIFPCLVSKKIKRISNICPNLKSNVTFLIKYLVCILYIIFLVFFLFSTFLTLSCATCNDIFVVRLLLTKSTGVCTPSYLMRQPTCSMMAKHLRSKKRNHSFQIFPFVVASLHHILPTDQTQPKPE